jgi:hypothetical protein
MIRERKTRTKEEGRIREKMTKSRIALNAVGADIGD